MWGRSGSTSIALDLMEEADEVNEFSMHLHEELMVILAPPPSHSKWWQGPKMGMDLGGCGKS